MTLTIREHEKILQAVLEITESQFGFVGEVLHDEQEKPFLRSYAVTNIGWNEEMRSLYERYITVGLDFRNLDTEWWSHGSYF